MADFQTAEKAGKLIQFWPVLGERNALTFLRAAEDHEWFRGHRDRQYHVRPAEPFEVKNLHPFEREKLSNAADLRVVAAGRDIEPKQVIIERPFRGQLVGRPVPVVPNVALLPDADENAFAHIRFHWSDPDSVNFREREADLARKREARKGHACPGFRAKVEVKRTRLRSPFDPPKPDLLREGCYEVLAAGAEAIASLAAAPQAQPPLTGRVKSPFDDIPREEPSAPSQQPVPVIETSLKLRAPWAQGPDDWPMPPGAA
jgi:hypothetical protein